MPASSSKFFSMHAIKLICITAALLVCMFLPFFPGKYDSLAVTLSFMVQLFSFAGLLLVPVGSVWLWYEMNKRSTQNFANKRYRLALVALITLAFVVLVVALAALFGNNYVFGILFLLLCVVLFARAYRHLSKEKASVDLKFNPLPIYLIVIPLVITFARFIFIPAAVAFSRDQAVAGSEQLISDIESYHAKNGHYPASLHALHIDYKPSVIGISQYHYEPNGNAYNLYFKQFSEELDIEQIVMYNKLNEHAFAAHTLDILEFTGQELALRRGDRHRYKMARPHWIYFKFD